MIKLLTIIGARPQIIKAAAMSRAIQKEFNTLVRERILHTGQHYDGTMSEIFFREMQIPSPDCNLDIGSASHGAQTGQMIEGIEKVLLKERPDGVLVYGDTNSTLAGADTEKIISSARKFLEKPPVAYPPVFGDGQAARQILKVLTTASWQ